MCAAVDITSDAVLRWARGIAQAIRRQCGLRGGTADADDLRGVADLELVKAWRAFDPARVPAGGNVIDAFKGFTHPRIRWAVIRHAQQLHTGGTLKPSDRAPYAARPRVDTLGDLPDLDGDPFQIPDRPPDDAPEDRPVCVAKAAGPAARRLALDSFAAARRYDLTRVEPADVPPEPPVSETAPRFAALETHLAALQAELQRITAEVRAAEQLRDHLTALLGAAQQYPGLGDVVRAELAPAARKRTA